jgi:hypothetical protein
LKRFSSNAHVLQWIDRRVGVPVCFLLTMARRLGDLFERRGTTASCRSVLFLKLAEQGSTVLAHEAIRTAVARVGRENVYFLVFEENRFIVDLLGLIPPGNVLTVRTQSAWSMAASCCHRLIEIRRRAAGGALKNLKIRVAASSCPAMRPGPVDFDCGHARYLVPVARLAAANHP